MRGPVLLAAVVAASSALCAGAALAEEPSCAKAAGAAPPAFAALARQPGRPQIDGLDIVYLSPLGDPAHANAWQNIIVHQTEGPPGSARREAADQFAHPTKRGVTIWVETVGTVYWSVAENLIPSHGEGVGRKGNFPAGDRSRPPKGAVGFDRAVASTGIQGRRQG